MNKPTLSKGGIAVTLDKNEFRIGMIPVNEILLPDNYCGVDMSHVQELTKIISDGKALPLPVILLKDDESNNYWIVDGRHRFLAYIAAGDSSVLALVVSRLEILNQDA